MIYINEYTGEKYKSAAECEKAEKVYLEAKKRAEEKARLDKAKREAEAKKKAEEAEKKKEEVKIAYQKALDATDEAVKALEDYLEVVDKTGYRVMNPANHMDLLNLLLEI